MNRRKSLLMLMLLVSSLCLTTLPSTYAQDTAKIYINPSSVKGEIGEEFTVQIIVENVSNLNMWELKLSYDTNVLGFPPVVVEGDFMKSASNNTDFRVSYSMIYGYVQLAGAILENVGANGTGVLANVTFTVLGGYPGKTDIHLFETKLYDVDMNPIDHTVQDGYFYMESPVADFSWTPEYPIANETVTFNASASFSPINKSIVWYYWDFGDGSYVNTTDPLINHTFANYRKDPYMINLTIADEDGRIGSATKSLLIWRDIVASDIWISDQNLDGSYHVIDPMEVSDYYPPYLLVLTATNLGTQTETFNVTLEFSAPTKIEPLWENPVTLAPMKGSGFSLLALWWPEDPEGNPLHAGKYNFTMRCSPVPGESEELDNLANNVLVKEITVVHIGSLYVKPDTTYTAGFVALVGEDFTPNSTVTITWDGILVPTIPISITTNSNGSFTALMYILTPNEPGVHLIKAVDEKGYYGVFNFTVLPPPIKLDVEVDVGSIHFSGETAEFYILTSYQGEPCDVNFKAISLYKPDGSKEELTPSKIDTGFYKVVYTIPENASAGTYTLIVQVNGTLNGVSVYGTGQGSFSVSSTLNGWNAELVQITNDIALIKTDIGAIKLNITELNARITSIEDGIVTIETSVGEIKATVDQLNPKITSIEGDVATIKTNIGTLEGKITSIEGNVATVQTDVGEIKVSVNEIKTRDLTPIAWSILGISIITLIVLIAAIIVLRKR